MAGAGDGGQRGWPRVWQAEGEDVPWGHFYPRGGTSPTEDHIVAFNLWRKKELFVTSCSVTETGPDSAFGKEACWEAHGPSQ